MRCRKACPTIATAAPMRAPAVSWKSPFAIIPVTDIWFQASETTTVTMMIAGGSLKPDSPSRVVRTFDLRGRRRRIANTAAASVDETIAAIRIPVRRSTPSTSIAMDEATATDTSTPTVPSSPAREATGLNSAQRVVNPPSNSSSPTSSAEML